MKADLVAWTLFDYAAAQEATGYIPQFEFLSTLGREQEDDEDHFFDLWPNDGDELAEFAGRNCYQSWKRPNPATAGNEGYLKNILEQGHLSVLEHASATFVISGASVALLGQLTRHRHLSYSVLSNRFVDRSGAKLAEHPGLYLDGRLTEEAGLAEQVLKVALEAYEEIVEGLMAKGRTRKQAREAARMVLPQGIETSIVVTGNFRAWRYVIEKRTGEGVDAEIGEMAEIVLLELKKLSPNSFQDLA